MEATSWVYEVRDENGFTPEDCASAIGCSRPTYLNRENNPGSLTLDELASFYRCMPEKGKVAIKKAIDDALA